jgi:hypothetical protein
VTRTENLDGHALERAKVRPGAFTWGSRDKKTVKKAGRGGYWL